MELHKGGIGLKIKFNKERADDKTGKGDWNQSKKNSNIIIKSFLRCPPNWKW